MIDKLKNMMKIAFIGASAFVLAACNTVKGVGQDIEDAGEKIEDVAEHNKPEGDS